MNLTNLKINDLITPDAKLTFLVGAGCSVDSPSCLPAGRAMMNAIIDYTCAESEIAKIKELKELRFEQLIEIIRDRLDPELKVIDLYGLCDKPNLQHFFLAEMMKNGQFVLTTNFDFLIEYALQHSGIPKGEVKIVITKEDFENFNNPQELYLNGVKTLYKIHGSTKNVLTGDPTRNSLIATIQAFGANKEGENVFQLEPFKQPLFTNITNNRSLVVMGYSGSDDFDIVPTLRVLKHIQDVIWINFTQDDEGKELIYEIYMEDFKNYENLAKVNQILVDIKRMNYAKRVLRVDVNTTRMVKELIPTQTEISSDPFSIDVHDWLEVNLDVPSKMMKYYIPYKIYDDFDIIDDAMNCVKIILEIAEQKNDKEWESAALNNIGLLLDDKGELDEALKYYREALEIDEQLGDLRGKATRLNNIGTILYGKGELDEALKHYREALEIAEQLGNLRGKAMMLNNIGLLLDGKGELDEALKHYREALEIDEQLGDLRGKAMRLNNIGLLLKGKGELDEALKHYREALEIDEQLGNLRGKATRLNNIGSLLEGKGELDEALKHYREALEIDEQLGDLRGKATRLNNIGLLLYGKGELDEALKHYREALEIDEQLGDLRGKATKLNNIGFLLHGKGELDEALKHYREALEIDEQLGDLRGKATRLNNIGLLLEDKGELDEALKYYREALEIDEQLGDLRGKATRLNNIGLLLYGKGELDEVLKYYREALEIDEQLGDLRGKATALNNIGLLLDDKGELDEALKHYREALEISKQLGSPNAEIIKKNIESLKSKMK